MRNAGPLAFIGGAEWKEGCIFDEKLLEASGSREVLIIPTAAAYEHPNRAVIAAQEWFSTLGATAKSLELLRRSEAEDLENAAIVKSARFLYLADGSPLHLRSVLKDSLVWSALEEAWRGGAVVAGSSAGGMIFGDPMVDPRGGAFTLGLGLVRKIALVPHWEHWTSDKARRMTQLIPHDVVVAEVEEKTALIRWPDGRWEASGAGNVTLTLGHQPLALTDLENAVDTEPAPAPEPAPTQP